MANNEKIKKYLNGKDGETSSAFKQYLEYFVENFDELKEVVEKKKVLGFTSKMKRYERLSIYLFQKHDLTWKDGKKLSAQLARNFYSLARRERTVLDGLKRMAPPEQNLVFRIFHPSDLEDETV